VKGRKEDFEVFGLYIKAETYETGKAPRIGRRRR
jgi:hypothetical protein